MLELVDNFHLGWNGLGRTSSSLVIYTWKNKIKTKQKKGYILNRIRNDNMLGMGSGIYAYRFIFDETRFYIGSAINLAQRFRQHRYKCSKNKGNNNKFYIKNMSEITLNMVY